MFELEGKLIDILNSNGLPLEAKIYVVQSVYTKLYQTYEQAKKSESEVINNEQMPPDDNMAQ